MKAKDYIEQLRDQEKKASLNKALYGVWIAMFEEIQAIGKARKILSDDAFRAILKEQEEKWKEMCRLDKRLRPEGFRAAFDSFFPMLKDRSGLRKQSGG